MSRNKKKISFDKSKKSRFSREIFTVLPIGAESKKDQANALNSWQSEIDYLLQFKYAGIDAVLDKITDIIIDKMQSCEKMNEQQASETKKFLTMSFENDPEVIKTLEDIFCRRGSMSCKKHSH